MKRIVCLMLTLIMLIGVLPMGASAASLKTSEAAITVLKKLTKFNGTCYQYGKTQEFRIGYGTVCNEKGHHVKNDGNLGGNHKSHKMTEAQADKALRKALESYDKKVNSFASTNKLSLTQSQHDALVVFSYDCGTAWMDGQGVVKTAVVNKAGANELLSAMHQWTKGSDMDRRRIEVNMYCNGKYSNVPPTSYAEVTYDPNGGSIAQNQGDPNGTYKFYFDTSVAVDHEVIPTNGSDKFLGWYIDRTVYVPKLTADCANQTLVARWQTGDGAPVEGLDYKLKKADLASTTIYDAVSVKDGKANENGKPTGEKVKTSFFVTKEMIASDGSRWAYGKVAEDIEKAWGWVMVKRGSGNTISGGDSNVDVTVTVTNSYVNSRVNATIHSATNGSYKQGQKLRIVNTTNADGFLWGQVAKSAEDDTPMGWIALMYTNWNAVKDEPSNGGSDGTNPNNSKAVARATITFKGYVNVRNEAGTDGKIVGSLAQNETVDVYEIKTVNGHRWGRTNAGWFCMTYANVTMLKEDVSDAGAMNYTFTGKVEGGKLETHVSAGYRTNTTEYSIPEGTAVTLTNLAVSDGQTWAKALWKNPEKDNKGKDITVTRSGWVPMPIEVATYSDGPRVVLDNVTFTTVSDSVSVRKEASNSADLVTTLNKGVDIVVNHITLVGENMWGYTAGESANANSYAGYVNLASKYVKRTNPVAPPKEEHGPTVDGKSATVINTDSLKVRVTGATYGKIIGTLTRGTTVRVWEKNDDGWYKVDSNKNGTYDYDGDGWVSGNYLKVFDNVTDNSGSGSNGGNTSTETSGTGTGIVANTYSGVNIRQGAGTGYAMVGKLLPGTSVKILEVKQAGAAKWGRIDKGWVCMDYITMVSHDQKPETSDPNKGNGVESLDKVDKTTTTAVYTGTVTQDGVNIRKEPNLQADIVRTVNKGEPITMHELVKVTDIVSQDSTNGNDGGSTTTTTKTSYWARVNEGYIYNPGNHLDLTALDEKVHTLTGSDTLNVRETPENGTVIMKLKKGDQVKVTALKIVNDKVWGRIETEKGTGWIRLDYMSEGAYYEKEEPTTPPTTAPNPGIGNTGNTGTGGFVPNAGGYKYTGKVIRTNEVNVRASASTSAKKTATLKNGASLVIYETTISENMAWGRCDAGWIYLYYVDLTPVTSGVVDARVVYNDNTIIYSDAQGSSTVGTYARMSVIDIYEIVDKMARTDQGWVNTDNLL